jgi:hypothetical protein
MDQKRTTIISLLSFINIIILTVTLEHFNVSVFDSVSVTSAEVENDRSCASALAHASIPCRVPALVLALICFVLLNVLIYLLYLKFIY